MDILQPVLPEDIASFSRWVLYDGFKRNYNNGKTDKTHLGHDFISYVDNHGDECFGLNPDTPIRSIDAGKVKFIYRRPRPNSFSGYDVFIAIQHPGYGITSGYLHVVPFVNVGDVVEKGQLIATLFNPVNMPLTPTITSASLPHLHFELGRSLELNPEYPFLNEHIDPLYSIPGLNEISVSIVSSS